MSELNGTAADADAPNHQPAPPDLTNPQNQNASTDPKPDAVAEAPGSRKPRDARIIHLILASMGVTSYQERVPLMLMDFAYRYTSSVLQDALLFSDSVNSTANTGGANPPASITIADLRMSVASRINHQFNTSLPKEFLLDIAQERNKVALPPIGKDFGVRLPPEKYCLTGVNWDLSETQEEWMEEDDDEDGEGEDEDGEPHGPMPGEGLGGVDDMDEGGHFGGGEGGDEAGDRLMTDA